MKERRDRKEMKQISRDTMKDWKSCPSARRQRSASGVRLTRRVG